MNEKCFKEVEKLTDEYGKGYVSLYSGWNSNLDEKARVETVSKIASLSYGNESAKNPEALYDRLMVLKHESLFEFITAPVNKWRIVESLRHNKNLPYFRDTERYKENIATFRIKTPLFVARQFMRHRGFSYLEMSRRYVNGKKVPFEFWFPPQVSEERKKDLTELFIAEYEYLVYSEGCRPEQARSIIPMGAYTEYYCQAEVKVLANFFSLRLKKDAQHEVRDVAKNMLRLIKDHQPKLYTNIVESRYYTLSS